MMVKLTAAVWPKISQQETIICCCFPVVAIMLSYEPEVKQDVISRTAGRWYWLVCKRAECCSLSRKKLCILNVVPLLLVYIFCCYIQSKNNSTFRLHYCFISLDGKRTILLGEMEKIELNENIFLNAFGL